MQCRESLDKADMPSETYCRIKKMEDGTAISKTQKFLKYILDAKSKSTFKQYRLSIRLFTDYYNETHGTNLTSDDFIEMRKADFLSENVDQQKRFFREIEKFHKWMIQGSPSRDKYAINSARNMTLGIIQLFKYYGYLTNVSFPMVVTTRDFVPTIQQYQDMYNVADLRGRVILSMALDLGWRISDFLKIEKDSIDLSQEPPSSMDAVTQKCNVVAKSFLSAETVELLKVYVPTLRPENPYLFQSNSRKFLDPETVGDILKGLAQKAKVKIPKGKHLRFHCFRKRFLSTCADLKIDVNTAKLLVGKDVESSMLTYLSEVAHEKAFLEVKEVLNLSNGKIKSSIGMKEQEIKELKKKVEELESVASKQKLIMKLMEKLVSEEKMAKAIGDLAAELGVGFELEPNATVEDVIEELAEAEKDMKKEREREQQAEYKRIIENGNGNGENKETWQSPFFTLTISK